MMPGESRSAVDNNPVPTADLQQPSPEAKVLIETFEGLDLGIAIYDPDRRLVHWNNAFRELYPLPVDVIRIGARYEAVVRAQARCDTPDPQDVEAAVSDALDRVGSQRRHRYDEIRSDGRVLEVCCFPLPDGGFVTTAADVTRRRTAAATARENAARFRDFARSASEWFWEMGPDLRFTFMSDRLTSSLKFSLKRVIGLTRPEAAGVAGGGPLDDNWRRHLQDLEARRPFRDFQYRMLADDGSEVYVSTSGVPVYASDGAFRGYRGSGIDRTHEVMTERRAREAQARLDDALESITEGFALFDADDRLVLCNANYRKGLARVADILVPGVPWENLLRTLVARGGIIVPEGQDTEEWVASRVREHKGPATLRSFQTAEGRYIEVREYPTKDGGQLLIRTDVTDRERALAALRASEQRFRDFASAASDWFWEMGPDLRFTWISHHFEKNTRIPADQLVGRSRNEFAGPDATGTHWQAHLADLEARRPFRNFRYSTVDPSGARRHVSVSGLPIFAEDGTFRGYRGTSSDITAQIEAEQHAATVEDGRLVLDLDVPARGVYALRLL